MDGRRINLNNTLLQSSPIHVWNNVNYFHSSSKTAILSSSPSTLGCNCFHRYISSTPYLNYPQHFPSSFDNVRGWRMALRRQLGMYALPKYKMCENAAWLYVASTDKIKTSTFCNEWHLEDTFEGWFNTTLIHIWMLFCRVMKEGKEGRFIRDEMSQILWEDVEVRYKLHFPSVGASNRKQYLVELGHIFKAALMSLDEGLLTDDKTLAAAIWRVVYARNCDDPRLLEKIVQYSRTQIDHLMETDREIFLTNGKAFEWAYYEPFHVS